MNWTSLGSIIGFFGVALGAFGAHAIQDRVEPRFFEIYKTASHYLMIHAVALVLFGLSRSGRSWPGLCFLLGIIIFCGSLFALVFTGVKALGAITPVGGLLFMAGWLGFALEARNRSASK